MPWWIGSGALAACRPVLQLAARIDALVAVVAFGLVLAIFHQGDVAPGVRPPTATEWAVINLAVGVASGVLFHLFLGPRGHLDEGRLFVALAGAIVVASGASYYLNLSPIFTNLVLGFILANSGSAHRDVTRLLLAHRAPGLPRAAALRRRGLEPGLGGPAVHRAALRAHPARCPLPRGRDRRRHVAPPGFGPPALGRGLLALGGIGVASRSTTARSILTSTRGWSSPRRCWPSSSSRSWPAGRPSAFILGLEPAADAPEPDEGGARAGAGAAVIRRLVVLALLVGGAVLLEPLRVPTEGVIAPARCSCSASCCSPPTPSARWPTTSGFPGWWATSWPGWRWARRRRASCRRACSRTSP